MLPDCVEKEIALLMERYPMLVQCKEQIVEAFFELSKCYQNGGKVLVVGNGGSAADAEHIVGELMKGFKISRKLPLEKQKDLISIDPYLGKKLAENLQGALPTISLVGHPAFSTAYMNDCEPLLSFAQQVNGYGNHDDVLLAISTSGSSENVLCAAIVARARDMKVIGLTGAKNSKLENLADICIKAPATETYKIQELHLPIYHCLCAMLEMYFFGECGK